MVEIDADQMGRLSIRLRDVEDEPNAIEGVLQVGGQSLIKARPRL